MTKSAKKIYTDNLEAIEAKIQETQGRATARTLTAEGVAKRLEAVASNFAFIDLNETKIFATEDAAREYFEYAKAESIKAACVETDEEQLSSWYDEALKNCFDDSIDYCGYLYAYNAADAAENGEDISTLGLALLAGDYESEELDSYNSESLFVTWYEKRKK